MNRSLIASLKQAFDRRYVEAFAFRLVARADAFPLYEATQHPDFNRFLLWAAPTEVSEAVVQIDKLIREVTLNRAVIVSICERLTGSWVGLARLQTYADGVEMGLYIHPRFWAGGVVGGAARAVVQTLLDQLALKHPCPVYVRVRPGNVKMEKICAFYHFEFQEEVTDMHPVHGKVELNLYRLRQDLWAPHNAIHTY